MRPLWRRSRAARRPRRVGRRGNGSCVSPWFWLEGIGLVGAGEVLAQRVGDGDREIEQQEGERLAVAVEVQRVVDAAIEDIVEDEVHRLQVRQQVTRDATGPAMRELRRDARLGHLLDEQGPEGWMPCDHADVGTVALVARAAVGGAVERHGARAYAASIITNRAGTSPRGTKHDRVERRWRSPVRTPPPPAGPQV